MFDRGGKRPVADLCTGQVIEAEDPAGTSDGGQLHLLFLAGLKTDRGSGRNVQMKSVCFFAVKGQTAVYFKK